MSPRSNTEILFDRFEIEKAINELAYQITNDYKDKATSPIFICVLNGGMMFTVELTKRLDIECEIDTIQVSSFVNNERTCSPVIKKNISVDVMDRDVIIIDDIYDSGATIDVIIQSLGEVDSLFGPKSIEVCCLCYRKENANAVAKVKYKALSLHKEFIFGFGMDYCNESRHLSNIYKVKL
jgi:hypoxanthine phosphoribosyltransferase